MKKVLLSTILALLLATGVQASQGGNLGTQPKFDSKADPNEHPDSIAYEKLTIKPEIQFRPSIDPDVKVEFIKIQGIKLYRDRDGYGRVVVDLEIIDYKGNHTFKTCEKDVEGGHGYYYEVVTEGMKVKGQIKK